jgi:hypothetical protein
MKSTLQNGAGGPDRKPTPLTDQDNCARTGGEGHIDRERLFDAFPAPSRPIIISPPHGSQGQWAGFSGEGR